jgi:hypothetical protein
LGNPNFFVPRLDYLAWPTWTYFYDTTPLRRTLEQLIDLDTLADMGRCTRTSAEITSIAVPATSKKIV